MESLDLREKEVAVALLRTPKTIEELLQENGFEYREMRDKVKGLIRKGVVEKRSGYPTKYYLRKNYWGKAMEWEKKLDFSSMEKNTCPVR